jgi:cytochrome c556
MDVWHVFPDGLQCVVSDVGCRGAGCKRIYRQATDWDAMRGTGLIAGAFVSVVVAAAVAAPPAAVIAERRAGMHRAGEIMRDLRTDILAARSVAPLADQAQRVADWAERLLTLFPPGSDHGDSNALASVWTDRTGFDADARAMAEQARRMVAAARAGDRAGFTAATIAAANACGQCHRTFRQR